MSTETAAALEAASATPQAYRCTFGVHDQTAPWTDVRTLSWPELCAVLTRHEVGPKEGSCIVPATFAGARRRKADARRIDVAMLDSDAGATLAEIRDAAARRGWAAVVSSTHSHLSTRTRAKRGGWESFRAAAAAAGGDPALAPAAFLEREKGYRPEVAAGARVVEEDGDEVVFAHRPCPKFRVAVPLLRPWLAADHGDRRRADAAWKGRIGALAAALGLRHDQACTDTSRLFFLPRRPPGGPPPETAVLEGAPCDLLALPSAELPGTGKARARGRGADRAAREPVEYTDPDTGEAFDLAAWARRTAGRFELAAALRARSPGVFTGKAVDGKHHVRCPNEAAHTQAGEDAATFVMDASRSETGAFVCHCRHAHCGGRGRLAFLRQMLERRWLSVADLDDPRFLAGGAPPPRPLIRYAPGELPAAVDQAERALLRAGLGLYQRGPFIVRPGRVVVAVSGAREVPAQRILEVGEHALVEALTLAADWERFDGRSGAWVRTDAPAKVAATYRQRTGRWRLPVLGGIVNAPTLRPDGTLLAEPGYDAATGLLFDPCGVAFPAIRDRPDRAAGREALAALAGLVGTFPFVGEADRAVALSAILSACVRRALPTAPLHAFTAPAAGSGKSMLVDVASAVATGREAGVIAQGRTEEELEKRLGALLLAGEPVVAIDNCEAPLGGEFLCSMLTQRAVRPRILGRSEAPELPSNAFVTATGNNLALAGDLTRRAVLCRLDPEHERPELRTFATDPVEAAKADRGRCVAAALTALRAYHVAGRPDPPPPLGSFGEWSGWVRGALLWLGQADPVGTMEEARDLDPRLDALRAVLGRWHAVLGGSSVSAAEVIAHAARRRPGPERPVDAACGSPPDWLHPEFRGALLTVAGDGADIDARRLGKWLGTHHGRIVDGLRLVREGLSSGNRQWSVRRATAAPDRPGG